jgi:hypothetical protein
MRILGATGLLLPIAAALQPQVTKLEPATARSSRAFRAYSMNRMLEPAFAAQELSDGRVLVASDRRFYLADLASAQVTALPDSMGAFVTLSRDSSLIAARSYWRILVSGNPVGQLPAANPLVTFFRDNSIDPLGADNHGNVYAEMPSRQPGDSFNVVRFDRRTGARSTVAKLAPLGLRRGGVCPNVERAAFFADGWIAVVRAQPYRVDWINSAGTWVQGAPIEKRTVAVTDAEKRIYHTWEGKDRDRIFPGMPLDELVWPATMCEWHSGYVPLSMPDGRVMVYRVPNSTIPAARYDVINRRGERERQVAMESNQAIVGFGAKTVYVRTIDGNKATISRHPLSW